MPERRVLVTGGRGQLAAEFAPLVAPDACLSASRDELDVSDADAVSRAIEQFRPTLVIHAAAWTNVDGAETDRDGAYAVNERGSRNVARAARAVGASLVAYSTDYVFPGDAPGGYRESDATGPRSVYGASKLAGEVAVREEHPDAYVVRTAWVFGPRGQNFVRTMLRLGSERDELRVVDDQRGSPTYTRDLAEATLRLVDACPPGTYHLAGAGACSWFELAEAIMRRAGLDARVVPITSAELDRPAPRPACSILHSEHACTPTLPPWEAGLDACLHELSQQEVPS
ncbi:MAG TPA: dTDP-4-dehydrorhamnose reductase [Gaiellales bacterium]